MNRYQTPIDQPLEQYVPIPLDTIGRVAQADQQDYDTQEKQNAATNSALANMTSYSPDIQNKLLDKANQFKKESEEVYNQYPDWTDPIGKRKRQELYARYVNDPLYSQNNKYNQAYLANQKIVQKLNSEGVPYADPFANGKAVDLSGNIVIPNQFAKKLDYIEQIDHLGSKAGFDDYGNGVKSNHANLNNQIARAINPNSDIYKQAYQHASTLGIDPSQRRDWATKAIMDRFKNYAHQEYDPNSDPNVKASIAQNDVGFLHAPTLDESQSGFNESNEFNNAGLLGKHVTGNRVVSHYTFGKSTVPYNRNVDLQPISGPHWHVGPDGHADLSLTEKPTIITGGKHLYDAVMGVIQDGPRNLIGQLVTLDQDGDVTGHTGNTMSEKIHKDPVTGITYGNWGTKDQFIIQPQAVTVYRNHDGSSEYVPLSRDQSEKFLGADYSSSVPEDPSQHLSKEQLTNSLKNFKFSNEFINRYHKATGLEKQNMNRIIQNQLRQKDIEAKRAATFGSQNKLGNIESSIYQDEKPESKTVEN